MGIFGTSSPFDQEVERATCETNTNEEWGLILEICDRAGASPSAARDCLRAVMRRLGHADPHVQVHAATLLDACVANCGRAFLLEVASRDFELEFRRLVSRAQPAVATRLRAMLRKWAEGEFRDDPQLDLIPSLHAKLSAEAPVGEATSAPAAALPASAATGNADREQEELARAIALSLRDAAPAAAPLYPRVDEAAPPAAPAPPPAPALAPARKVRALYDFEAAEDNELTFQAGEILLVTDASDPNWWKGRGERGEGLFPANFVTSDLTEPAEMRVTGAKSVQFTEPAAAAPGEVRIDETVMDEALALLHDADPAAEPAPREPRLAALEARVHAMGPLVDAALERADRCHARLTQLSADLVDALNLYHSLMRDPKPVYAHAGLAPVGLATAGLAPAGLAPPGMAPAGLPPVAMPPPGGAHQLHQPAPPRC